MQTVNIDAVGEMMMLAFQDDGPCTRPIILVGPADDPSVAETVYSGPFFPSFHAAARHGRRVYFETYFQRYGFHHPEDPSFTGDRGSLPASVSVLSFDAADGPRGTASRTYDPDQVSSRH